MNRPALTRTVLLAAMAFASTAFAASDINKCVTPAGHVTLTDSPCPSGSETVKVINGPDDDAAASSGERYTVARPPARHAALMRTQPARGLSLDVAMLKTARANMQLFDSASQALRAQRIAALQ
jgi:hypothetical protein